VSTAQWTGVSLVEIRNRAGIQPSAREVIFRGADSGTVQRRAGTIHYERSLTPSDAKAPQVLLAYAMNGEPLPVQHGYPVRLIVPGWYGMTAVKWLTDIRITDQAFAGHYQTDSYHYEWKYDRHIEQKPVSLQRVRSLITEPLAGDHVPAGELVIRGLAWSGMAPIARLKSGSVTKPWQCVQLPGERSRYHWQHWELTTRVASGDTIIKARATDLAGYTQPEASDGNRWGYGNNSIQQVVVHIR
jgi:DMSO/TMAO reductase YedYZ molybdopterin-dependent catalytic subunit